MSIQSITFRCDHPGCTETFDVTHPPIIGKWTRVTMPLVDPVIVSFDYCPRHAKQHPYPMEQS